MPTSPEALVQRIVHLEATLAQQEATIQQLRDELAERDRRIAEAVSLCSVRFTQDIRTMAEAQDVEP